MPIADLLTILGIALAASVGVTLAGAIVLRLMRRAPLRVQMSVVVVIAVVAVVVSMLAVSGGMFLSPHDLGVAIAVALIAGAASLALSVVLGFVITRNMRGLARLAQGIGVDPGSAAGGPATDTQTGRITASEFRQLADELTLTSARLQESRASEQRIESARRELVAGISHDLRTPLAGIRAMAEALEDDMVSDRDAVLRQMRSRVDQLSLMIDDLFELSKLDAGVLTLALSDISLYDLVSDAIADLGDLAAGREITVEADAPDDLTVRADARELSRAVTNLLMNAVQHTPAGTPVTVIAGRSADGRPRIGVRDAGGGIDEADLPRLFDAGWRGQSARPALSGRSGGAGLGLAIVAGIVRAHDGETTVRNVPGGVLFEMLLPA